MWCAIKATSEREARLMCESLIAEGIIVLNTRVALPFTPFFPAVAFPEKEKEPALCTLGLHNGPLTATRDPNIRLLLVDPVTAILHGGDSEALARSVVDLFRDDLPCDAVLITNPHSVAAPPLEEEGVFHIRIYSAPGEQVFPRLVHAAFGRILPPGVRDGIAPSGIGTLIHSPEGPVAEVVGRNLYILFDITHPTDNSEVICSLLAQILEAYVEYLDTEPNDHDKRFIRAARRRLGLERLISQTRLDAARERLRQADLHRQACAGTVAACEARHRAIEDREPATSAKLEAEFRALKQLPHVRQVWIEDAILHVETDEVYVQHDGLTYPMGPFHVELPLWAHGRLRIISRNPKLVGGTLYHTPHVFALGNPCLGGFSAAINQTLEDFDWGLAVQLILEFLHKINGAETRAITVLTEGWTPLPEAQPCYCEREL